MQNETVIHEDILLKRHADGSIQLQKHGVRMFLDPDEALAVACEICDWLAISPSELMGRLAQYPNELAAIQIKLEKKRGDRSE